MGVAWVGVGYFLECMSVSCFFFSFFSRYGWGQTITFVSSTYAVLVLMLR